MVVYQSTAVNSLQKPRKQRNKKLTFVLVVHLIIIIRECGSTHSLCRVDRAKVIQ